MNATYIYIDISYRYNVSAVYISYKLVSATLMVGMSGMTAEGIASAYALYNISQHVDVYIYIYIKFRQIIYV